MLRLGAANLKSFGDVTSSTRLEGLGFREFLLKRHLFQESLPNTVEGLNPKPQSLLLAEEIFHHVGPLIQTGRLTTLDLKSCVTLNSIYG